MKIYHYDYRVDDDPDGEFSFGEPFPPIQKGTYTLEESEDLDEDNPTRLEIEDRIAQDLQEIHPDEEITYLDIRKVTQG